MTRSARALDGIVFSLDPLLVQSEQFTVGLTIEIIQTKLSVQHLRLSHVCVTHLGKVSIMKRFQINVHGVSMNSGGNIFYFFAIYFAFF